MGAVRTVWWLGYFFVGLCIIAGGAVEINDFISINTLPDGEVETRIHYRGVCAKETAVAKGYRHGLKFRQLTDGKHFIQLIYDDNDAIRDCEYITNKHQIHTFMGNFKSDLRVLLGASNITIESLDNKTLPGIVAGWMDYNKLRHLCRKRHKELKIALQVERETNNTVLIENERRALRTKRAITLPGTVWCGPSDDAYRYEDLGQMARTDKCCRKHDCCKMNILPFTKRFNYYNGSPFTVTHCFCDARYKRDLSDLLRVPGTKWCGKGYSATKFTQLGGFSKTDKCCRVHDTSCPFWIGGFETKYQIFNWRVNTLMHCSCDERFRACLKMADTSDANLVGKIFFDIVQTKCFVLKPKKICAKHSWWGTCLKKKYIKQAILRDNPRFK